jgi:hypothetical protein
MCGVNVLRTIFHEAGQYALAVSLSLMAAGLVSGLL